MVKKEISDEEYERIKSHISEFLYLDLVIWRNDLINSGNIYNRLYTLIEQELLKRNKDINNKKDERKGK